MWSIRNDIMPMIRYVLRSNQSNVNESAGMNVRANEQRPRCGL